MSAERFKRILLCGYTQTDLDSETWARLDGLAKQRVLMSPEDPEFNDQLRGADCLLIKLGQRVDRHMIDQGPALRLVGILGTGCGQIDVAHAADKGIVVCNIAGYSTEAVAEFAFAAILFHLRELGRARDEARSQTFAPQRFEGTQLCGRKFGVVGLGNIGGRIASIASRGFEADVCYWSRTRKPEHEANGIRYRQLDTLLEECDFVSVNLALTADTTEILNAARLRRIKPGAVLVNLSPMELVDMEALQKRLNAGDITVILDHTHELSEAQLAELGAYRNCELYPSIAYMTREATASKRRMLVDNLEAFLTGRPINKVN